MAPTMSPHSLFLSTSPCLNNSITSNIPAACSPQILTSKLLVVVIFASGNNEIRLLEDFLMQRSKEKQSRLDLEEEVKKLQAKLEGEQTLGRFLHCALHGPVQSHPRLLSLLGAQVQELFSELAMVEEEIGQLDRKVVELKLRLYKKREQTREWKVHMWQLGQQKQLLCGVGNQSVVNGERCRSEKYEALRNLRKEGRLKDRRASVVLQQISQGGISESPMVNCMFNRKTISDISNRTT